MSKDRPTSSESLRRSGRPIRLLVAARELPRPDRNGGDLRLFEMLRLIAGRHEVTFYPEVDMHGAEQGRRAADRLRKIGVRVLDPYWTLGLERTLLRTVYDGVVFEFWESARFGAGLVRRHQPWAKVIVDSVDIHFRREEDGLSIGISDPARVEANKHLELAAYREADAVICVSEQDGRALDAEGGVAQRVVVPLIVPGSDRSARDRVRELLFLGGFRHAPNLDGLLWFAGEIWPEIRSAVPDARLTIIGSEHPAEVDGLSRLEGVEVVGYVPEVGPWLERALLMVAPLRFGAGMKSKVVEAMASGLAVVTTPVGAQGLGAVSGEHLVVADTPAEFARSVVELLLDPVRAEEIGRLGRRHVARLCSPEEVSRHLEELLTEVIGRTGPSIPPAVWWARSTRFHARKACGRFARAVLAPLSALRSGWQAPETLKAARPLE
jgi:glycosyltransferase involved in cell wall biosynthesis